MIKKYKFHFDILGLLLFFVIMIPNLIWFVVPAPNDILREKSLTPVIDTIGSISQIIFVALLCIVIRVGIDKIKFSKLIIGTIIMVGCYFVGWIVYYCGITTRLVVLLQMIPPCLAFTLYAVDRKNVLALIPILLFTICHIIYGFVNFII